MLARVTIAALLLFALPGRAGASPRQCLGTGRAQYLVDETLLVVVNPEGFEHQIRAALCVPLAERPGLLFDYTQIEVGLFNYLGPIYDHQGAYASIVPISFLQLRADVAGLVMWPLPLDGAGYFALDGYRSDFRDPALPQAKARTAVGYEASLSATLQFAIPLSSRIELLVTDVLLAEAWGVGEGSYYFNPRRDVVLARGDWLFKNTGLLLLEIHANDRVSLRIGATDDLSYVPGSGYLTNIIGVFASLPIRREGAPREIEPFVRVAGYTAHASREGVTVLAGLSAAWGWPERATRSR